MKFEHIRVRAIGKFLAELKHGQYIDTDRAAVVCCTDEPLDKGVLSPIPHCCVQFYDTEEPEAFGAFTREHAATICEFLRRLPDTVATVYCCCDWGQSRSAGLAAALLTTQGKPCEPLFLNSAYHPNLLVYATMCEALECGRPSGERLAELDRLRRHEGEHTEYPLESTVRRIVLAGAAEYLAGWCGEDCVWPTKWSGLQAYPIKDCRAAGKTIPYTEKELIADMHVLGPLSWEDMLLVMLGPGDIRRGLTPEDIRGRLRKYLHWLRYIGQGAYLLLVSPLCCPEQPGVDREQLAALHDGFSALANELGVDFLDVEEASRLSHHSRQD